jgi:hypothetical protein
VKQGEGDAEHRYREPVLVDTGRRGPGERVHETDGEEGSQSQGNDIAQEEDADRAPGSARNFQPGDLRMFTRHHRASARGARFVRQLELFDERMSDRPLVAGAEIDENPPDLTPLLLLETKPGAQIFRLDVAVVQQHLTDFEASFSPAPVKGGVARSGFGADGAF